MIVISNLIRTLTAPLTTCKFVDGQSRVSTKIWVLPLLIFLILSGYSALIHFISSNCVYSFYMADIVLSPFLFIPFLYSICVNIASTAILCISFMNSFSFYSVLVSWVPYLFPTNFISSRSTTFPGFSLLALVMVLSLSLVSILLASVVSSYLSTGASWSLVSIWYFFLVQLFHVFIVVIYGIIPDSGNLPVN